MRPAILWLAAVLLLSSLAPAGAQTAPPDQPQLKEFCALLKRLEPLSPAAARSELTLHAGESSSGLYLLDALNHFGQRQAAVQAFLAPADPDGSLRADFNRLAPIGLKDAGKKIGDVTAQDFGGGAEEPEKDGFEHNTAVYGGGAKFGLSFAPAAGIAHESEYKHGPWGAGAAFEGTFSPGINPMPATYSLGVSGTRDVGKSPVFALVDFDSDHDSYLGARGTALRAGAGVRALNSNRQELTVSLGVGPNTEAKFNGETEHFLSPAVAVDYTFKLANGFKFVESIESEFNAVHTSDIELKAVTSEIWDLSKKLAVKASHTLKMRTEQVEGHAKERSFATLGFVWTY